MSYRILVTGSRTWTDFGQIRDALHAAFARGATHVVPTTRQYGKTIQIPVLVTGACPTGADKIAKDVWLVNVGPDHLEEHRARWSQYGKSAGINRNIMMVDTHPDEVLAFLDWCRKPECAGSPAHRSHGATQCSDYAESQGLTVRRHYQ